MADLTTREQLESVFAAMASYLQENAQFRSKIAQADVSLGFLVPEIQGDVALRFHRGEVSVVPGGSGEARIAISMNAATLQKTLSGKQDPQSAYDYGAISLRGSEYEAEGLLMYWRDIVAAFKAATGE